MPITNDQRVARRGHIGASDVAAIFDLDPFNTAYNVWAEKTGKLHDEVQTQDPNDVKNIGNLFEPAVISWAAGILGEIESDVEVRCPATDFPMVAHCDGVVIETGNPVEAKTSGLKGPLHEHWGDEGTDDVPFRIILQVSAQMMCVLKHTAHIPAFLGGRGLVMFEVVMEDQETVQLICDKLGDFWDNHVLKDIPPDDSQPTMDVIKRIIRTPKEIVAVDSALVASWQTYRDNRLSAEKDEKAALADVLAALGTAEGGECDLGLVTFLQQTRKAYTVKESTFPVARFKKAR